MVIVLQPSADGVTLAQYHWPGVCSVRLNAVVVPLIRTTSSLPLASAAFVPLANDDERVEAKPPLFSSRTRPDHRSAPFVTPTLLDDTPPITPSLTTTHDGSIVVPSKANTVVGVAEEAGGTPATALSARPATTTHRNRVNPMPTA
jgi:hypothetical protein